MAASRPAVPVHVKRVLVDEAGGKCANPGCPNRLVELHHIEEWHVYHTHDESHMIALCPACHDSVDRGSLQISDDELYAWKGIPRDSAPIAHLYVEPGPSPRMLLGSMAVEGDSGLVVFDFAERHMLSFAVRDGEIFLLNLSLAAVDGRELVDVVDGHVRMRADDIELEIRPGRIRIPIAFQSPLISDWARSSLLDEDPLYGIGGVSLLDVAVVEPGLVRVQGIWLDADRGVVITQDKLSFLSRERPRPLTMFGEGVASVIHYSGPITQALFQ